MFVMPCDFGMTWNGSACAGTRRALKWSDCAATALNVASIVDGVNNVGWDNTLFAKKADSCSTAGRQVHEAAEACSNLVAFGKNDWYLPSSGELGVLFTNRATILNFDTTATGIYWSSSEAATANGNSITFTAATVTARAKNSTLTYVRCVRKGGPT